MKTAFKSLFLLLVLCGCQHEIPVSEKNEFFFSQAVLFTWNNKHEGCNHEGYIYNRQFCATVDDPAAWTRSELEGVVFDEMYRYSFRSAPLNPDKDYCEAGVLFMRGFEQYASDSLGIEIEFKSYTVVSQGKSCNVDKSMHNGN